MYTLFLVICLGGDQGGLQVQRFVVVCWNSVLFLFYICFCLYMPVPCWLHCAFNVVPFLFYSRSISVSCCFFLFYLCSTTVPFCSTSVPFSFHQCSQWPRLWVTAPPVPTSPHPPSGPAAAQGLGPGPLEHKCIGNGIEMEQKGPEMEHRFGQA